MRSALIVAVLCVSPASGHCHHYRGRYDCQNGLCMRYTRPLPECGEEVYNYRIAFDYPWRFPGSNSAWGPHAPGPPTMNHFPPDEIRDARVSRNANAIKAAHHARSPLKSRAKQPHARSAR